MRELPSYYTTLFNAVTDALRELEKQNYGNAKELLVHGQLQAEGECIALGERET